MSAHLTSAVHSSPPTRNRYPRNDEPQPPSPGGRRCLVSGLNIRTDTWRYCAIDRVLPMLAGEQMLMADWVVWPDPGGRVLDVGTGSGLYALLAARAGCEATGVDRNPRAVAMARENALRNGLRARFVEGTYPSDVVPPGSQDLVILTPPYHPTAPLLAGSVAFHAEAGELGLDRFQQFLAGAVRHLRPGGRIVLHQMSPGRGGVPAILDDLDRIAGPALSGRLYRLLPTCNFGDFLAQVYADPDFAQQRWVERTADAWPELDLLMGEIVIGESGSIEVLDWPGVAGVGWADRIELHARIAREALVRVCGV